MHGNTEMGDRGAGHLKQWRLSRCWIVLVLAATMTLALPAPSGRTAQVHALSARAPHVGFETIDKRVRCIFGWYASHPDASRQVECSSPFLRTYEETHLNPEEVPCLAGGEDSPRLNGPGAILLVTWGRPVVLLGCSLATSGFSVLKPGQSTADGVLVCVALTADEVACRSRHSGQHFALNSRVLRLR
jgi:hypothetical protein